MNMDEELKEQFMKDLLGEEPVTLTDEQEEALAKFMEFFKSGDENAAFLLTGSAGTGKTFMINIFTRMLRKMKYKVVLLAPTGRAAKVISKRAKRQAYTIHHHIYSVGESLSGDLSFELKPNKAKTETIYLVDEASMIGDKNDGSSYHGLLQDLLTFVFSGDPYRKLVLVGDPVQLPPVNHNGSPALDPHTLLVSGHLDLYHAHLSEVKRQLVDSEVLENAVLIRDSYLSGGNVAPQIQQGREVQVLENGYEGIETYLGYYEEGNLDRTIFITYSNYRAVHVNMAIRHHLFFEEAKENMLLPSELIMVVKNNYSWGGKEFPFIANGEMGTVRNIYTETLEEKYDLTWVDAEIEFQTPLGDPILIECKVVLDLLQTKVPQLDKSALNKVYQKRQEEYYGLSHKEWLESMRKDPYVNALQIKYGYAVTGHKSQGGQWENVIIGFEPDYGNNPEAYIRWAYTVFTRAESRVFLLDCPFTQD